MTWRRFLRSSSVRGCRVQRVGADPAPLTAFPAALQKQGDNPGDEEIRHATEKLLAPYRAAAKAQAAQLDSPFIVK